MTPQKPTTSQRKGPNGTARGSKSKDRPIPLHAVPGYKSAGFGGEYGNSKALSTTDTFYTRYQKGTGIQSIFLPTNLQDFWTPGEGNVAMSRISSITMSVLRPSFTQAANITAGTLSIENAGAFGLVQSSFRAIRNSAVCQLESASHSLEPSNAATWVKVAHFNIDRLLDNTQFLPVQQVLNGGEFIEGICFRVIDPDSGLDYNDQDLEIKIKVTRLIAVPPVTAIKTATVKLTSFSDVPAQATVVNTNLTQFELNGVRDITPRP